MATLGQAFRAEVEAKVGHGHTYLQPRREPTWADVEELYPESADLARAVGLGGPGDHKPGTRAWRRRKSFLDQTARWRRGGRNPMAGSIWTDRLKSVVRAGWRRASTPGSVAQVLAFMREFGVTVYHFAGTFTYDPRRARTIRTSVACRPWVLEASGFDELSRARPTNWAQCGQALINAWASVYGMGELPYETAVEKVGDLSFRLGIDPNADWDEEE